MIKYTRHPDMASTAEKDRQAHRTVIAMAAEFGFRACEKGMNLQGMQIELAKIFAETTPPEN